MKKIEIEIKVGIFVFAGLLLTMASIILLGGGSAIFENNASYYSEFKQIEGLVEGGLVKMSGIQVGEVSKIEFLPDSGKVRVEYAISRKFQSFIHEDSHVDVQTQGMLGDKFLSLSPGSLDKPLLKPGSEITSLAPKELRDYLSGADTLLARINKNLSYLEGILGSFEKENRANLFFKHLTQSAENLKNGSQKMEVSMKHVKSILTKIDQGSGTLGALVNDTALYDDMRNLLGGANRNKILKFFIKKSVEDAREQEARKQK